MSESLNGGPRHLLPRHLGGEFSESAPDPKERRNARQKALDAAPDFGETLRKGPEDRGIQVPETLNLSLLAIEDFQRLMREAQDLRVVVRNAAELPEKIQALTLYKETKSKIDEYLSEGLSFEKAYREYIRARNDFVRFESAFKSINALEEMLREPAFASLSGDAPLDERSYARLEQMMRQGKQEARGDSEQTVLLEALETIYPKGGEEYNEQARLISESGGNLDSALHKTKKDIEEELASMRKQQRELWESNMVRYFWKQKEMDTILKDFAQGNDVIETQSVIKNLNALHSWETQHQRTTIGGVLVGPPGVGKTTLARHYLESKGRNYTYLDLSEDVTRYLLYGSKSIEFKSPVEYYKQLADDLGSLDEEGFARFIRGNAMGLQEVFGLTGQESVAVLVSQLQEELGRKEMPEDIETRLSQARQTIEQFAQSAFHKELAGQFAHLVKHNGWRDGVIISALRRDESLILDEFNKNKNWSLIYGLLTAKPGEEWYFADNDERIKIPEDWRMYFTANIGRKHGGFEVAEALASRAGGKVMEVGYPPLTEEMQIALASLSDAEGDFLRSKDDLAKLYVLIHEVFPKVRNFIEDKRQAIPISYRTLRDIGEKLVLYQDKKSGKPVYHALGTSFDKALYDVLIESYALYEDKTIPKEIVNLCTSVGLLFDDAIQDDVLKWMDEQTYQERKNIFAGHKEDFNEIVNKIRGLSKESLEVPLPHKKQS